MKRAGWLVAGRPGRSALCHRGVFSIIWGRGEPLWSPLHFEKMLMEYTMTGSGKKPSYRRGQRLRNYLAVLDGSLEVSMRLTRYMVSSTSIRLAAIKSAKTPRTKRRNPMVSRVPPKTRD
jgi:hypothetical protein